MRFARVLAITAILPFFAACAGTGTSPLSCIPIICTFVTKAPAPAPPPPPPPAPAPDPCAGRIVLRGVNFAFDRSDLDAASQATLDVAVDQLNRCPNVRARVEGHTDWIGSNEYNDGLSLRRSKSVVDYMIGRGVSPARLESAGFGETQPIATNDTSEGRALNRRVELKPLN